MFLQAGIRPHGRWLGIFAYTLPADRSFGSSYRIAACELYRFSSGDTAWIPSHRRWIAWPHQVEFINVDGMQTWQIPGYPRDPRPFCRIDTREERRML